MLSFEILRGKLASDRPEFFLSCITTFERIVIYGVIYDLYLSNMSALNIFLCITAVWRIASEMQSLTCDLNCMQCAWDRQANALKA